MDMSDPLRRPVYLRRGLWKRIVSKSWMSHDDYCGYHKYLKNRCAWGIVQIASVCLWMQWYVIFGPSDRSCGVRSVFIPYPVWFVLSLLVAKRNVRIYLSIDDFINKAIILLWYASVTCNLIHLWSTCQRPCKLKAVATMVITGVYVLSFAAPSALDSTAFPGCASLFILLSKAPFALSMSPDMLYEYFSSV